MLTVVGYGDGTGFILSSGKTLRVFKQTEVIIWWIFLYNHSECSMMCKL